MRKSVSFLKKRSQRAINQCFSKYHAGGNVPLAQRGKYGYSNLMDMQHNSTPSTPENGLFSSLHIERIEEWEWALAGIALVFLIISIIRLFVRQKRKDPQVLHHFSVKEYKRQQKQQDPESTGG